MAATFLITLFHPTIDGNKELAEKGIPIFANYIFLLALCNDAFLNSMPQTE